MLLQRTSSIYPPFIMVLAFGFVFLAIYFLCTIAFIYSLIKREEWHMSQQEKVANIHRTISIVIHKVRQNRFFYPGCVIIAFLFLK